MTVNDTEREGEGGKNRQTERERKEKESQNWRYKERAEKRTPPLPTAAPQIEGHGDKKLCGNQRSGVSPQQPKREIVKGEKRGEEGEGECHQKRSGGIRSEREFTTLFLCTEPAGLEITNVSRGRAPAVSREGGGGGEEERREELTH